MNTLLLLVMATAALSGIAAGASLDVSIRQLPARHRIGIMAYSQYSQATDLGTAKLWYPPLGIGTLCVALATAILAFFQQVPFPQAISIYLTAFLWIVHLLITLIWALPILPRQRYVVHDEQQLGALFNQFERLQAIRAVLDVLIFALALWALVNVICPL